MAEEKKKPETKADAKKEASQSKQILGLPLMTWVVLCSSVLICAGGGIALAQLLAGPKIIVQEPEPEKPTTFDEIYAAESEDAKAWQYNLDPVVANLDEPGVTRYVRATISIEMSSEMDQTKGTMFLEEKRDLMIDWLNIYLSGLSLERVRGSANLARIKNEIRDSFNSTLFPESKPLVTRVLLKEFAVQ